MYFLQYTCLVLPKGGEGRKQRGGTSLFIVMLQVNGPYLGLLSFLLQNTESLETTKRDASGRMFDLAAETPVVICTSSIRVPGPSSTSASSVFLLQTLGGIMEWCRVGTLD